MALVTASVSIASNLLVLCRGKIKPADAVKNVAEDTITTAAVGYGVGFFGTVMQGIMSNSTSAIVRSASRINLAGSI